MARNEHTSAEIAAKAAQVMKMTNEQIFALALTDPGRIRSIAASAVTQAKDRKPADEANPKA